MCLVALRQRESEFAVFDCFKETLCHISSALLPYFLQQLTLTGHKEAVSALTFSTPSSSSPTLLCSASADSVLLWGLEQEDSEGIHNKQQQTTTKTTNNNENNNQSNRTSNRNLAQNVASFFKARVSLFPGLPLYSILMVQGSCCALWGS